MIENTNDRTINSFGIPLSQFVNERKHDWISDFRPWRGFHYDWKSYNVNVAQMIVYHIRNNLLIEFKN